MGTESEMNKVYVVEAVVFPHLERNVTHYVSGYRDGKLLLKTWHKGRVSVDMETQAWERRGHERMDDCPWHERTKGTVLGVVRPSLQSQSVPTRDRRETK